MARRPDPDQPLLFGDGSPDPSPPQPHSKPPRSRQGRATSATTSLAPINQGVRALAAALSPLIRLGTSSWSFPGWRGLVWESETSAAQLARDGLRTYAKHPLFRTVGLDKTFYRPAPVEEFARLREQVTDDFRFLVKAHAAVTTREKSAEPSNTAARFLDAPYAIDQVIEPMVQGLGPSAGPLLFQFPPMGLRTVAHAEAFIRRLGAFLGALPAGPLYTVEVRDRLLLRPALASMLSDCGVIYCYSVHPTMPPPKIQMHTVDPIMQRSIVCRWMLHGGLAYDAALDRYQPFDRLVDPDPNSLEHFARLCALAIEHGKDAWVVINNKAEGCAPRSVERLAQVIASQSTHSARDQRR